MQIDHDWLEHDAMEAIKKDKFDKEEQISWGACHVFSYKVEVTCTSITHSHLMSLFYEYACSFCSNGKTLNHSTNSGYAIPNPGQIPVIAFDIGLCFNCNGNSQIHMSGNEKNIPISV